MKTQNISKLAKSLGEKYLPKDSESVTPFSTPAWLAPINGNDLESDDKRAYGTDVYELLASDEAIELVKKAQAVALFTAGWASPINKNVDDDNQVAPSKHPERKRVALMLCCDSQGKMATAIRIGDGELMVETEGRGALAEAMLELVRS